MPTRPCPTCSRPAQVSELPETAMGIQGIAVRVQGLARTSCAAGHTHLLPPGATERATAEVDDRLVTARLRGVLRRRETCATCEAELVLPSRPSHRPVPFDVDGRVLTVFVEAPMVRCPDCGRDQLPASVGGPVRDLLARAIAEADRPTG